MLRTCSLSLLLFVLTASSCISSPVVPKKAEPSPPTLDQVQKHLLDDIFLDRLIGDTGLSIQTINALKDLRKSNIDERKAKIGTLSFPIEDLRRITGATADVNKSCEDTIPRIHNIGTSSIIAFRKSTATTGKDDVIQIPIEGRDLQPNCVEFDLSTVGYTFVGKIDPATMAQYIEIQKPTNAQPDHALLVLKAPYIARLNTDDRLEVHIAISHKTLMGKKRIVSYSTRTFTFYEADDFKKKVLDSRVPLHDIEAFPLPEAEVLKIYGPLIAREFFVVDLSIRNRQSTAKLVSTGMIVASGRAIVCPGDGNNDKCSSDVTFTVPVSVIPRSSALMYTVLDDEEVEQPRSKFFRSLEFVGALASAASTAFGGMVVNQAVNLFSGVFIPASKKALPDRWPGFKRNIVNNAMPDLFKIPATSVGGHKHLFFSKNKISAVVGDPTLFGEGFFYGAGSIDPFTAPVTELYTMMIPLYAGAFDFREYSIENRWGSPLVRVISLAFDHLDIPFEEVLEAQEEVAKTQLSALQSELPRQLNKLKDIKQDNAGIHFSNLVIDNGLPTNLAALNTQVLPRLQSGRKIETDLAASLKLLEDLGKTLFLNTDASGLYLDLLGNADYSLQGLQASQSGLTRISLASLAGSISAQDTAIITKIDSDLKRSVSILNMYEQTAQKWKDVTKIVLAQKDELKKQPIDAPERTTRLIMTQFQAIAALRDEVRQRFKNEIDPMSQIKWDEIRTLTERVLKDHVLELQISGAGKVKIMPIQKECSTDCQNPVAYGVKAVLSVSSGTLKKWGGACSGTGVCEVIIADDIKVTAEF